jgi:hypothetical protein
VTGDEPAHREGGRAAATATTGHREGAPGQATTGQYRMDEAPDPKTRGPVTHVREGGFEHPSRPSRPVAARPPKPTLTRRWTAPATLCHAILSSPVLTRPLANSLQKGGRPKINNT